MPEKKKSWSERNTLGSYAIILGVIPLAIIIFNLRSEINPRPNNTQATQEVSEVRLGEASVYSEISQTTDCQELREKFTTAELNGDRNRSNGKLELARISTEYMKAIDKQMKKVNCY